MKYLTALLRDAENSALPYQGEPTKPTQPVLSVLEGASAREKQRCPEEKSRVACFCGTKENTWLVNAGTCWEQVVCERCQGKVRTPPTHRCDASLPTTAPCVGHRPPPAGWVCPHCGESVEIEAVEPSLDGERMLTFWHCQPCQSYAVTASDQKEPPVWVTKRAQ